MTDNEPTQEEIEAALDLAFGAVADMALERQLDAQIPDGFVEKTTNDLLTRIQEDIARNPDRAEIELPTVEQMFQPPFGPAAERKQKAYEAIARRAREQEPMDRVWFSMDSLPDVQFMIDRVEYEVVQVGYNDSHSECSIELRRVDAQNESGYND